MSRRTTRLQTGALVPVQLDPFSDTLVWKTKMHASDAYAESQAYHEMAQDRNLKRLRIPSSEGVPLSPSEAANATYFAAEIHPEDGWEPYPPESVDDMDVRQIEAIVDAEDAENLDDVPLPDRSTLRSLKRPRSELYVRAGTGLKWALTCKAKSEKFRDKLSPLHVDALAADLGLPIGIVNETCVILAGAGIVQKSGNRVRWHPRLFDASIKQPASVAVNTPKEPEVVDLSGGDDEHRAIPDMSVPLTATSEASPPNDEIGSASPAPTPSIEETAEASGVASVSDVTPAAHVVNTNASASTAATSVTEVLPEATSSDKRVTAAPPPCVPHSGNDASLPSACTADDAAVDVLVDTLLMFAQPRESDGDVYEPGMDDEMPSFLPAPHVKTTIDKLKQNTRELLRYARSLNEAIERVEKQTAEFLQSCYHSKGVHLGLDEVLMVLFPGSTPPLTPLLPKHVLNMDPLLQCTPLPVDPITLQRDWKNYSTLFVGAPPGTFAQIPDPDEGLNPFLRHRRRYQLIMHSPLGGINAMRVVSPTTSVGRPCLYRLFHNGTPRSLPDESQPSRCVEDTKQAHWNQKLMSSLSTMMMAPWARYDESYTIPPPEIDEAGFPVNDGVDRTLSRTVYFNRVTGIAQYERPEAGMMRDAALLAQATSVTREYLRNIVNVEVFPPEAQSAAGAPGNVVNAQERASYITPLHIASAGMKLLGVRDMAMEAPASGKPSPAPDAAEGAASHGFQRSAAPPAIGQSQAHTPTPSSDDRNADANVVARMTALGDLQRAKQRKLAAAQTQFPEAPQ